MPQLLFVRVSLFGLSYCRIFSNVMEFFWRLIEQLGTALDTVVEFHTAAC